HICLHRRLCADSRDVEGCTEVAEFYNEVGLDRKGAICVSVGGATVGPLLGLGIYGVEINIFIWFPAGAIEENRVVRQVIVLVSPNTRRVKERRRPDQLVLRVHATGNENSLIVGKFGGGVAAALEHAGAGNQCFIKRSEN